jgi:hypothetical protein
MANYANRAILHKDHSSALPPPSLSNRLVSVHRFGSRHPNVSVCRLRAYAAAPRAAANIGVSIRRPQKKGGDAPVSWAARSHRSTMEAISAFQNPGSLALSPARRFVIGVGEERGRCPGGRREGRAGRWYTRAGSSRSGLPVRRGRGRRLGSGWASFLWPRLRLQHATGSRTENVDRPRRKHSYFEKWKPTYDPKAIRFIYSFFSRPRAPGSLTDDTNST